MLDRLIHKIQLIFVPCVQNRYRPKFLASRFLFYYVILLLVFKILILPFSLYLPKTVFFADLTRSALIELTNQGRTSLGLSALTENQKLNESAFLKARDMIEKDYFSHQSPEGITPWHWFQTVGYNYQFAGENLAIGFLDSEEVYQAWLDSISHKRNLLNPNFNEIGMAVLKGDFQGNETTVVVQIFGALQAAAVEKQETIPQKEIVKPTEIVKTETLPETTTTLPVEAETVPAEEKTISGKTTSPTGEVLAAFEEKSDQNNLMNNFLAFLASDYYNLIQKIIYISLIFIVLSLLATVYFDVFIYRAFEIQYRDIVLKAIVSGIVLIALVFIDKGALIQIIPHDFRIN